MLCVQDQDPKNKPSTSPLIICLFPLSSIYSYYCTHDSSCQRFFSSICDTPVHPIHEHNESLFTFNFTLPWRSKGWSTNINEHFKSNCGSPNPNNEPRNKHVFQAKYAWRFNSYPKIPLPRSPNILLTIAFFSLFSKNTKLKPWILKKNRYLMGMKGVSPKFPVPWDSSLVQTMKCFYRSFDPKIEVIAWAERFFDFHHLLRGVSQIWIPSLFANIETTIC